jgi:CheY-like chemotaxis protein
VLDHPVHLDSLPGRGSHFSVEVPLVPALPVPQRLPERPQVEADRLAGTVILCIDNEPKILDGMAALLGGWGCHVLTASGLDAALGVMAEAKERPDGLLVDYRLDDGNGIDAIIHLRWRFGSDLPAILITADRSVQVREEAQGRGILVLNKPLKPAALRALLAQWRTHRIAAAE